MGGDFKWSCFMTHILFIFITSFYVHARSVVSVLCFLLFLQFPLSQACWQLSRQLLLLLEAHFHAASTGWHIPSPRFVQVYRFKKCNNTTDMFWCMFLWSMKCTKLSVSLSVRLCSCVQTGRLWKSSQCKRMQTKRGSAPAHRLLQCPHCEWAPFFSTANN